jgi:hypothetical protein
MRFKWTADTGEQYTDYFQDLMDHPDLIARGDCDDYGLTYLHAMCVWGVGTKWLRFLQVLSKAGQRSNYYFGTKYRSNHNMGGVADNLGRVLINDSNESPAVSSDPVPIRTYLNQTNYQIGLVYEGGVWYEGDMR